MLRFFGGYQPKQHFGGGLWVAIEKIDYTAVLADLEARRDTLEQIIAGIKRMLETHNREPLLTSGSLPLEHDSQGSDAFGGMGIAEAAKKHLRTINKPQTTIQIANALERNGFKHESTNFAKNVYTSLYRDIRESGDVVRRNRKWSMSEWYTGNKKQKTDKLNYTEKEEQFGYE